jgi:hypothetical protein
LWFFVGSVYLHEICYVAIWVLTDDVVGLLLLFTIVFLELSVVESTKLVTGADEELLVVVVLVI